jgi:hypothetical protein
MAEILAGQQVADMGNPGGAFVAGSDALVARRVDPLVTDVATPIDFAAQYPTPLDPTEVIAMCEEVNLLNAIPDRGTGLQQEIWRELNELAFTSGSNYIAFADGACPEEYFHDGDNTTVNLKNIGAKKSLTISDIIHSQAVTAGGSGIRALLGGWDGSNGMPGGAPGQATMGLESIANLKEKEVKLGMTLVLNGEDRLLAVGNASSRPLEFSGIETQVTSGNGAHTNLISGQSASGTFSAQTFDRFLGEACAKPTHIFGHPQAIQELMSGYFQLGFQGSQVINFNGGDRLVPGFSFAGFVQTGVGRLQVVADNNFTKVNPGGTNYYQSSLYALRMTHNGVPLVYRSTQIPLSLTDLAPGCTAVSFEIWKKTALIIKAMCAQSYFQFGSWTGRTVATCTAIG